MGRVSEVIRGWLGWCPDANTMRTSPTAIAIPPVSVHPAQPGGGAGGPGRIDRGINLVIGSLRILIRNRHLLWFSLLTGLVLLFSLVSTTGLQSLSGIDPLTGRDAVTDLQPALIVKGSLVWLALTFTSQLVTAFCTAFLLAGLISCVSLSASGRAATIHEGLTGAANHILPIAGLAVFYTVISLVQSVIMNLYPGEFLPTLIWSILIFPLGILTVFVIPVIVLEGKHLAGAFAESVSLFKKTWGEILLGFFLYLGLSFAVGLVAMVPAAAVGFPSGNPLILGLSVALYMFVLMILIMIFSTAFGIFIVGLYTYARTGRIPALFEEKQDEKVPV